MHPDLPFTPLQSETPFGEGLQVLSEEPPPSNLSLMAHMRQFHAKKTEAIREKMELLEREVSERQEAMRLVNAAISELNRLTDERNAVDLTRSPELQKQLTLLKEKGVKILEGKSSLNSEERNRLIDNLHTASSDWDQQNRTQTQKMEILLKTLDRVIMMMKEVQRGETQAKRGAAAGIKGG